MSNITLNAGAGGATLATDTVTGIDYQKVKVTFSTDGTAPTSVDAAHPLPVASTTNLTQLGGTAVKTGSGVGAAGSLSVYLATDQPTLTNAQPVLQSGSWAVSVSGTAAVSAAALPLPAGASTSAKQPAIGTAGAAATDVLSVQGIASMIALKVDGSAVTQPVSGTFWQATQPVSIAALPALAAGANTIGAVTQASGPWTINATEVGGASLSLGSKTSANSVPVVIASDQSAVPALQSGTWTVQPGNTPNTSPWLVTDVPTAGAGASVNSQLLTASGVISANIKAAAGSIYSIDVTNNNATPVFARLYDKATAPATTDTPIWRGIVPGNAGAAGMVRVFGKGLKTAAGIGIRVTGAIADNDATNVNNVAANVEYA